MVRVNMRVDDVTDRKISLAAHRFFQILTEGGSGAAVNHRNAFFADDETDVGDVAAVFGRELLLCAFVHENAGRRFAH